MEELAEAVEGIRLREGEKYAVLRALQVASERGFRDLKIRSDCNGMRRRLRRNYEGKGCQPRERLDGRISNSCGTRSDSLAFVRGENQRAHSWRGSAELRPDEQ